MAGPFPGMDPWLGRPAIFGGAHHRLISFATISSTLAVLALACQRGTEPRVTCILPAEPPPEGDLTTSDVQAMARWLVDSVGRLDCGPLPARPDGQSVVAVGLIRNETDAPIDMKRVANDVRDHVANSHRFRLVGEPDPPWSILGERARLLVAAGDRPAPVPSARRPRADLVLTGQITSYEKRSARVCFYVVAFQLHDVLKDEVVWTNETEARFARPNRE